MTVREMAGREAVGLDAKMDLIFEGSLRTHSGHLERAV
jgi:hypothetical protein